MNVAIIIALIVLVGFLVSSISGAPWVPARKYDLDAILNDVKLSKQDTYIELGCGDGRLMRAAAKRGATVIGYELNPLLWLIAWLRMIGQKNVRVILGNFWEKDLTQADVVMAFLVPRTMPRLGKKADAEMKRSARLVSYIFPIPHKKPSLRHKSWYVYVY